MFFHAAEDCFIYPENGCSIIDSKIKYITLKSLLIEFMVPFFHLHYFYFVTVVELNSEKQTSK